MAVIEENTDRRKKKVVADVWGDGLESRTSHLSARMIEEKVFEEHPFWEGGGLVLCEPYPFIRSIHSAKRMFFYSSFSSYHPGAKLVERHGILNEFRPPNSRNDLCLFSSVLILPL